MEVIWDYTDDYYFAFISKDSMEIEINIRAYTPSCFGVWINEYNQGKELMDEEFATYDTAISSINELLKIKDINFPSKEEILKISNKIK